MKLLRTCIIIGCILMASSSLADWPAFNANYTVNCVDDQFQVTITVSDLYPDLLFMVYRDAIIPNTGAERLNITPEPVPTPAPGENLVFTFTDPDINPQENPNTAGRYVIEATWWDGSLFASEDFWLSCGETFHLTRGYLIEDYLVQPCEGSDLLECTAAEILYGHLTVWAGSNELLDFFGTVNDYDPDGGNCMMTIYDIVPVGPGAVCQEVVATERETWSGIKAIYR